MLGQVPGQGPNALQPLEAGLNPAANGAAPSAAPILPLVQQQVGGVEPPSHSMIELGRRYS